MRKAEATYKIYKFFGYSSIRPEQEKVMNHVTDVLTSNKIKGGIIAADPGIGKEACMVSQSLSAIEGGSADKAVFVVPTDAGKINIMHEFKNVASKHSRAVLELKSKDFLCKWLLDKEDDLIQSLKGEKCGYELCKAAKERCPYHKGGCPYYIQKEQIPLADILVCDYNYIFAPFIKKAYQLDEWISGNVLLFINECHELADRIDTIYSKQISTITINHAIKELEKYGKNDAIQPVRALQEVIEQYIKENGSDMRWQIEEYLLDEATDVIASNIFDTPCKEASKVLEAGKEIRTIKCNENTGVISHAERVGEYMARHDYQRKYIEEHKTYSKNLYYIKLKNDFATKYIGWVPVYISNYVNKAIEPFCKCIMYSGTCEPRRLKSYLGLEKFNAPPRIESPFLKNRKDIILTNKLFIAKNRKNKEFINNVHDNILHIMEKLPKPAAIISTKKWFSLLSLQENIEIMTEPNSQEQVNVWLESARSKEYLYYSPHGRLAKSVDMNFIKGMLIVGFPRQPYDAIFEARRANVSNQMNHKNKKSCEFASDYILGIVPAYESVVQSVMRGLRSEKDELIVVYYDKRFEKHNRHLNSKTLELYSGIDDTCSAIDGFNIRNGGIMA